MKALKHYLFLALLFGSLSSLASHIVGGELIYDFLGNNKYRIILKVYRDCSPSGISKPDFDGTIGLPPALLTVLRGNGVVDSVYDIGSPVITKIPPTINNPCIQTPNNICVEEGVYTYTLTLPPIAGGYYLVYQRCCRNGTILNLLQSGNQGSTYSARIPGPEEVQINNSPRFKFFPPIFLCNDLAFTFDHSAIDPDGDQLVYSLCPPFLGMDACCAYLGQPNPSPSSQGCVSPPLACATEGSPPPYATVNFVSPYSGAYPVASNPSVTINSTTGLLKGTPNIIGQFVVGICVQEFRNGQLIATHFRDFQFNIVPCIVSVISAVADQQRQCMGNTINFVNQSTSNLGGLTYHWDFGDPNQTNDTSNIANPTYTYQDTGVYIMTLIANPGKPCTDTIKKEVYIYPSLDVRFDSLGRQCLRFNSFPFTVSGDYLPVAAFEWDFTSKGTPSVSSVANPTVVFSEPGLFYVKLKAKQFVCRDSFIDTVRVLKRPQALINNLPASLCDPATVGFSNGSSSDLPLLHYWNFSNGLNTSAFEPIVVLTPAGVYTATLMVVTQGVCNDSSIVTVNNVVVRPKPRAGFRCTPDVTTIFEPQVDIINESSFDVYYWQYNFGDMTGATASDVSHFYQDYGDYVVTQTVTTQFGCTDTTSRPVKILPEYRFWVPNTFTPDGSGLNDVFKPVLMGVDAYVFEIFDRWGEKVFHTNDVKQGWDGKLKGQKCKQDVYVWRIKFRNVTDLKEEIHTGHVLILRNE